MVLFLSVGIAVAAFGTSEPQVDNTERLCENVEKKPLVVKIHADWCGSCRATAATWERIEKDLAESATIVRFDVTDRPGHDAARAEALRLGLDDFFQEYRRRTGVIAILRPGQQTPVSILAGERDFGRYVAALEKACSEPSED